MKINVPRSMLFLGAVSVAMVLMVGTFGAINMKERGDTERFNQSVLALGLLELNLAGTEGLVIEGILPQHRTTEEIQADVNEHHHVITEQLHIIETQLGHETVILEHVEAIDPVIEGWIGSANETIALLVSGDPHGFELLEEFDATFLELEHTLGEIGAEIGAAEHHAQEETHAAIAQARNVIWGLTAIAGAVMAILALLVSRVIMKPLKRLGENLGEAAEEIYAETEGLSNQANQDLNAARDNSAAADMVDENITSVVTAVDELASAVSEISQSSAEIVSVTRDAVQMAGSSTKAINELGRSSSEIGTVVELITTIAEQTNLLALNATIEAARAGESGKGFAVVANEVKELAKQTTDATTKIGQRITSIQSDTATVVTEIAGIVEIVDSISEAQLSVSSAVEEQQVTTREIANQIEQASHGSSAIFESVRQTSTTAEEYMAAAGRARSAADLTVEVAEDLGQLVGNKAE